MDQIIIVTGGNKNIDDYQHIQSQRSGNQYVIGVDAGAAWLIDHAQQIDLAVGDFDSIGEDGFLRLQRQGIQLERFHAEKDETDTELALSFSLLKKPKQIIIYGGVGNRFDHSLANVHLLLRSHVNGIPCEILDPFNRIRLIDQPISVQREYPYISLLPFTRNVLGVTLTGFKYPLQNANLEWGMTLGISNELKDYEGTIKLTEGLLLVIESRDNYN